MNSSFNTILDSLPGIENKAKELKEILLANLAMIGEIPAPTFKEEERIEFLINRFKESGIQRHSIDQVGNGVGIVKGENTDKNILLVAHTDTVFDESVDHTIQIQPRKAIGPGVADNSLGLAVLATLPVFLEQLDITLENNLILMAATRSLGRGNLEGLRFFLSNFDEPIKAGIGLEGVELGRLSHTSIGMRRGEVICRIPEQYDWSRFGDASAILTINDVINRINEIQLPQRPRTSIILGSIKGGSSFTTAREAVLRFEIRSESSGMVEDIHQQIEEIINEISSRSGESIELDIFAQREPGGVPFSHPIVQKTRRIMNQLSIEPRPGPSTSELSAFIDRNIPAITLGITHGSNVREKDEAIDINPIYKGIAQVIGTLQTVDGGYCEKD
ncbi:MAG: M20/M25/M40 family metallo-hydrolase [Balneolaceae bacterium]|nr:M20/M25/M40 family metallo-hydrolase [Balneolaceae bacterium]